MFVIEADQGEDNKATDLLLRMRIEYVITIFISLVISFSSRAQVNKILEGAGVNVQFAGSTAFLNAGVVKRMLNEKMESGLMYGHTPGIFGGPLHSATVKFLYNPWQIRAARKILVEPLQPGVFLCQHFGKNFHEFWSRQQYPRGYYWWPRSLRRHLFISSAVSYDPGINTIRSISVYFETNTNDLYLASYLNKRNYKSLSIYDIIFFGVGLKVYL